MAQILESPDWDFKTTTFNMLRALIGSMQGQMDNIRREMEILRNNFKTVRD